MAQLRKVDYDPFAGADEEETPDAQVPAPDLPPSPEPEEVEPEEASPSPPKPARSRAHLKRVDYDPFGETTPQSQKGSFFVEAPKAVAAGVVGTTGTGLKGLGGIRQEDQLRRAQEAARAKVLPQDQWPGTVTPVTPELRKKLTTATESVPIPDLKQDPFYQAGLATTQWSDKTFKAAHDYENSWTRAIGQGLGSTVPFLAAGLLGPGGLPVSMQMGAAISTGSQIEDALNKGATKQQLMEAIRLGGIPGMTEPLPIEVIFERIPLPMWGKAMGYVSKVAAKAFAEGGQEGLQQVMQNLIAKYTYNPKQDIMEGVWEAAGLGAIIGGGVAAPFTRPGQKPDETQDTSDTVVEEGVTGDTQPVVQPEGPGGQGQPPAEPVDKPATTTVEAAKEPTPKQGETVSKTPVDPTLASALGAAAPVVPGTTPEVEAEEEEEVETPVDYGEGISSAMAEAVAARKQSEVAVAAKTPEVTVNTGVDPTVAAAMPAEKPKRQRKPKVGTQPTTGEAPVENVPVTTETLGTPEAAARRTGAEQPAATAAPVPQVAAGGPSAGELAQSSAAAPAPVEGELSAADQLYRRVREDVINGGVASASRIGRELGIGMQSAERILQQLELEHVLGPQDQSGRRQLVGSEAAAPTDEEALRAAMPRQAAGFQLPTTAETTTEASRTLSPMEEILAGLKPKPAPAATPEAETTTQVLSVPAATPAEELITTPIVPSTTEKLPPKAKKAVEKAKAKAKKKAPPKPRPEKKLTLPKKAAAAVKVASKPKVEAREEAEVKAAEKGKTVSKGKVKVEEVKAKAEPKAEKKAEIREEKVAERAGVEVPLTKPVTSHAAALADAIKAEMARQDKDIFARGDAHEVADKVAELFTKEVSEETPVGRVIAERTQAGAAQVESRLKKRAAEEEKTAAAKEESELQRAREAGKERRLTGAPEDRARHKEGGRAKTSTEVASEDIEQASRDKALAELAKKEAGEEHIPEYAEMGELFRKRKSTPRTQKPAITSQIKAKRQELVDRLAREEATAAPAGETEGPSKAEQAVQQAAKLKSGPQRAGLVDPIVKDALTGLQEEILPANMSNAAYAEKFHGFKARLQEVIKKVSKGLRELSVREGFDPVKGEGFKIREKIHPANSPAENLVAYLKAVAFGRKPSHGLWDVWQAVEFFNKGKTDDMLAMISDSPLTADKDFQSLTGKQGVERGVILGDDIAYLAHGAEEELEDLDALRELEREAPKYTPQDPYFEEDGTKYIAAPKRGGGQDIIPYFRKMSGREALDYIGEGMEEDFTETPFTIIRNFLNKRLKQLVGDVDVVFISQNDINYLARKSGGIRGLYYQPNTAEARTGWKPVVYMSEEFANRLPPELTYHTLAHELTHAATVYAMHNDINGTAQAITQLRLDLTADLKRSGHWDKLPRDAIYGLTTQNNAEFIAEAFTNEIFQRIMAEAQVPRDTRAGVSALLQKIPMPSWMQAFVKVVSNALGEWSPMAKRGEDYLTQVIQLHPHLFMSSEEQLADVRTRSPFARRAEQLMARRRMPRAEPNGPWDIEYFAHQVQQNAAAAQQAAAKDPFNTRSNRRWYGLSSSYEIRRRAERWFGPDSAIYELIDTLLSGRKEFENERQPGAEITAEMARYADANPAVWREVEDISHDATVNELNPWDTLGQGRNSHVKVKKGKLKLHLVDIYKDLNARVKKLPQEAQDLMRKADAHYGRQHDRKVTLVVKQMIADAVENLGVKLPAGVSEQDAADWVLDGRVDRQPPKDPANPTANERTKYDQDLHDALKGTAKQLQGSKAMRKIKGFYTPLMRQGKYFFSAIKHLDAAALKKLGGYVDTAQGKENQILFPNESDYLDFVKHKKPADMHINDVTVDHVEAATGSPVWTSGPDKGKKVGARDVGAATIYRVHVQNRAMEMNDSHRTLKKLQRQYHQAGYEVHAIDEIDKIQHSNQAVLPNQINALLRNIEQSNAGQSQIKLRAIQGAVISAYHKQLAGNRAAHRTLKRQNVKGYARNMIHAMDTTNRTMAGNIVNLIKSPKIAKLEKALNEEMQSSRYADKGGQLARRMVIKEIRKRIEAAGTRSEHYWGASVIRNAMAISFMSHLVTGAYVIANLTQPFATTWPVLASHWKGGRGGVLGEMAKAYWQLGAGRIMGRGLLETGKQAFQIGKRFRSTEYDFHARTRNQMGVYKDGALLQRGMDRLSDLGLSAEAGTELPEVSELGMNVASRTLSRTAEVGRTLPTAAEAVNRYVTLMVATRLAKRGGMSDDAAVDYAVSMVEKTQGGYAAENNPNAFSGKYIRAPLQFKKYPVLYGQLYYGALMDMAIGQDRQTRVIAAKQLIRASAAAVVLSGVGGIAIMEVAKIATMVAALLGLDDDDWEDHENQMQEWFAAMLKYVNLGEGTAEAIMRGPSRWLGFDTSSRLGNDNMIFFGEPRKYDEANVKAWAWDMAIGAPGGMISDVAQDINNGDWEKAALHLMPKMFSDLKKAYDQSQQGVVTKTGKQTVPPTSGTETFWQALGFRPASVARQYEAGGGGAEYKKGKREDAARTAVMQTYRNAPAHQRQRVFRTDVARWNRAHPRNKIDMGDLRKSVARKKQEEKKQRGREHAGAGG